MRSSTSPTQRTARQPDALVIRLTRRPDGAVVFTLRRPDGSSTWQKRTGPTAEFFAVHDLTHYAVETTLRYAKGFYGLVAEGWDLTGTAVG